MDAARVSPAILLQGAVSSSSEPARRAGRVTIVGVDDRFWLQDQAPLKLEATPDRPEEPKKQGTLWNSRQPEAVVNDALAEQLGVAAGEKLTIHLQKRADVPRETLLGRRQASDAIGTLTVTVRAVITARDGGRFSLDPSPVPPLNLFVPLALLQARLDEPGRINALFVAGGDAADLQKKLHQHLTLDDWGLVLLDPHSRAERLFAKLDRNGDGKLSRSEWHRHIADSLARAADRDHDDVLTFAEVESYYRRDHNYVSLESRQMLLEPEVANAAQAAAAESKLHAAPTLVYLANTISDGSQEIPYSVVAALDPSLPAPIGPFLPSGIGDLADDEIILADWKDSPLKAPAGSRITLTYFEPEQEGGLREAKARFRLKGRVVQSGPADDPNLTPEFPGITDKLDIRDWNPPFPYDNKRVGRRDEDYWNEHRTAPKAYVSLAAGQRLWGSRFGNLTSIRLALPDERNSAAAIERFRSRLLSHLRPEQGAFVFQPVRGNALSAATGGTDFGGLFLGFSFFLIVAALLLIGLLVRLNLDRRASEVGVLLASGYPRNSLRWLLLAEGGLLALCGALVGAIVAVLYAWVLLELLRASWPGSLDRSFLRLHPWETGGLSYAIGYGAAVVASVLTIFWAERILGRAQPSALLAGQPVGEINPLQADRPQKWTWRLSGLAVVVAVGLLISAPFIRDHEMQATAFFGSGALLLAGSMAGLWGWMRCRGRAPAQWTAQGLTRLGIRNASRYPLRSLLTAGLIASAVFVVIAVESFHREPDQAFADRNSGSGGFTLIGESNLPVYENLNAPAQRRELGFPDAAGNDVQFFALRRRAGDDASCLNLYQPRRPRLLGASAGFLERGGFRFQESEAKTAEERANPWTLLTARADDTIPAIGDATTVQWMLKNKLGGVIEVPNEQGDPVRLRIVGLLSDSIFQSELLVSEENFLRMYPHHEGFNFFLVSAPPSESASLKSTLESSLAEQGFEATSSVSRLASYLAVENTYLSTFQALGGLGLLLGALGMAVVLLRTVWERRGELALLRALGFRRSALAGLVISENSFLLVVGAGAGTLAALLAVVPHRVAGAGEVPWLRVVMLVILVLIVGVAAGAAAAASSLRASLIPALRRE